MKSFVFRAMPMLAIACSSAAATPPRAVDRPIGDTGFVVSLPEGYALVPDPYVDWVWKVEGVYETVGTIPHSGTVAQLTTWINTAPEGDEILELTCGKERRDVVDKPLPGGGRFVSCFGPSLAIQIEGATFTTQKVEAWTPLVKPAPNKRAIRCSYEADNPALTKMTVEICKTLRPKT